jgi:glucosamine-6-phosphate deaminase
MLAALVRQDIEWSKVRAFHLDEYIRIPETHPHLFENI